MPDIGRITRVPLRDVWPHEAIDFTPWLRDNLDALNEILGITLIDAEIEQPAGTFSVDMVAQTEEGPRAVIENQLEKTDHDHLGKLITYLANIDEARIAIWITKWPRAEHITAINWLNEATDGDFYLVKLEAVRIGDSPPAPIMTLVVEPSEEVRSVRKEAQKTTSEDAANRFRFWTTLLERAKERTRLHVGCSPKGSHYYELCTGAHKSGLSYCYELLYNATFVELNIQRSSKEENLSIFNQLLTHKDGIEKSFGSPLDWREMDSFKRCGIASELLTIGGRQDEERWEEIIDATVDMMIRLHAALQPYIDQLD
jgi:hypothetical protein